MPANAIEAPVLHKVTWAEHVRDEEYGAARPIDR